MNRADLLNLLERYARNQASPEEIVQVDAWLDSEKLKENPWQDIDQQVWLSDLKHRIDQTIAPPKPSPVVNIRWRAIASIAAILLITFSMWWFNHNSVQKELAAVTTHAATQSFTLADGSTVWLNKNSKLSYPSKFEGKHREVYLEGEAYFDIRHNAEQSFIVHTGNILTTVIGTAFNISAVTADSNITVTVTRGAVKVSEGDKLLDTLTPNQQLLYNFRKQDFRKTNVDATKAISWNSGELLFDDITFGEAAEILSKKFNVRIGFARNEIRLCRFTGTALNGKNLDEILKVICAFNKANYKRLSDGNILIDGEGCRN